MKFRWLTLMLAVLLVLPAVAAPPLKRDTPKASTAISTDKYINVNKILMFVTNQGNFAYDAAKEFGQNDGLYYPYTTVDNILNGTDYDRHVIFDAGLWMGAVDSATNDTLVTVAEYSAEFGPGQIDSNGLAAKYRVYKLYADSMASNPNSDYLNWPVDQGAPVDTNGLPKLIGDQMSWSVYNDGDPSYHTNNAGNTLPMGVEVQQTSFAYNREDAMGNIVFIKFKIKNGGAKVLKNFYASIWSDPDLGGASDDLVGCDSLLSLGYCYNATNADQKYGSRPPAVGFDFFQGPLEFTGDVADTAKMWGQKYPGYRNQPMSSFNKYINGTDPSSKTHTYNYMQGLNRDGTPYVYNSQTLKFFNSGDPVAGTGDLDADPADRRLMLTTGPFNLRPGDSTEILAAIICGQGSDRLTSISAMKYYDRFAQSAYDLDFNLPSPPRAPIVKVVTYDGEVSMSWGDISETDHGDYPFEGYTVLQGPSAAGPWTRIQGANYDIRNGVALIFDDVFDLTDGVVINKPVAFGSDPGVRRWFSATTNYLTNDPLFNASDYFYRIEAYSYNPAKTPKTLTSATVLKAVPQKPVPEKNFTFVPDSIIPVRHAGISDGQVLPQIINPDSLTGHTYKVWFYDSAGTVYWTLYDSTLGVNVLTTQANQGATPDARQDYKMVDGMLVHVYGPPPGYKPGEPGDADSGWSVPVGARRFTQAGGADGLHMEGFRGTAGWAAGPGAFFEGAGVGASRLHTLELRLAATDSVGNFNPADSNVSYAYRYLRRASQPPAQPSFGPYIVNPGAGYAYQDFLQSAPLSVWDIDGVTPRRLAIGFLENNRPNGTVDGRYWPPYNGSYDNTDADGPREWLFVFDTAYSTTADPTLQVDILNAAYTPMMLLGTWAGRNDPISTPTAAAFNAGDIFRLFANHINYTADTFTFVATAAQLATSGNTVLDKVRAVPNPYYLFASYDRSVYNRRMQFTNLPTACTVSIFTLTGDRVAVLTKNDPSTSLLDWNLLTDNQVPVASGIYVYVVDAPGFGQKIGKMAIFTEQEQLGTY